MEFQDPEEDNFLDRFRNAASLITCESVDDDEVQVCGGASSSSTAPVRPAGQMALPGSWQKPQCKECSQEEGPEGGGRYGTDDHDGFFYCDRCWQAWDAAEKAKIMKPAWQQRLLQRKSPAEDDEPADVARPTKSSAAADTDDIEGAWDPSQAPKRREGEMALPGSWERPICVKCGNDEGEEGGGRYGHRDEATKFFCGRCWQSWDEPDRLRMMLAYAPRWADGPVPMDPMVFCPAPEPPPVDDDCWGFDDDNDDYGGFDSGDEAFRDEDVLTSGQAARSSSSSMAPAAIR